MTEPRGLGPVFTPPDTRPEAPPKRRRLRRWLLELGVLGAGYALISRWQTNHLLPPGSQAPNFETTDVDGQHRSLSDYAGRQVILHFWATWCGVCRQEFSMLNALALSFADSTPNPGAPSSKPGQKGPILVSLVADDDRNLVSTFLSEHTLHYPVLFAPRSVLRQYRVDAFPTTYYLSENHVIGDATVGMSTRLAMRARSACS